MNTQPPRLRATVRQFRILRSWRIRMSDDPNNHGTSWGGRMSNRYSIGTWDPASLTPEPPDYLTHEVLHAALIALTKMDRRSPKELAQASELLVQDICQLITKGLP